jgi:hypothetical protein
VPGDTGRHGEMGKEVIETKILIIINIQTEILNIVNIQT